MVAARRSMAIVGALVMAMALVPTAAADAGTVAARSSLQVDRGFLAPPRTVDARHLPSTVSHPRLSRPLVTADAAAYSRGKAAAALGRVGRTSGVRTVPATASTAARSRSLTPNTPGTTASVPPGAFVGMTLSHQVAALGASQQAEPPDTQIAVGPASILEMVNVSGSVWSRSGVLLGGPFDLNALFGVAATEAFGDPQVLYDQNAGKFIASGTAFSQTASRTLIAVSSSSDPMGAWVVYLIGSSSPGTFFDQPKLAVSTDKIVLSWYDIECASTCALQTPEIWVIDRAAIEGAAAHPAESSFKPGRAFFGIVPARELSSTDNAFMVYLPRFYSQQSIGIINISGPAASAHWSEVQISSNWTPTAIPPDAQQPDGAPRLSTGDDRLLSAVWNNGVVWAVGNDACIPVGDTQTRSCIRLVGSGPMIPPTNEDLGMLGGDLLYPVVSSDAAGDLFLGANESSIHMYSSVVALVTPDRQAPTAVVLEAGQASYDSTPCGGVNRWGDYAGAAPDPANPGQVWLAGEFTAPGTNSCDWGTALAPWLGPPSVSGFSPTSGPRSGGQSVVISGTGFSSATSVTFGDVEASFSVTSDASITATVPVQPPPTSYYPSPSPTFAPGPVALRVTSPYGQSRAGSAGYYTYVAAQPSVSQVSPAAGSTSGGAKITVSGNNLTAAQAVNFGGAAVPTANFLSNSDSQIVVISPAAPAGTVDLIVSSSGGTSPTTASDQFVYRAPSGGGTGAVPAVSNVVAEAANGSATLTWSLASDGGASVVDYVVTPYLGWTALPATTVTAAPGTTVPTRASISGLAAGTYRFKVIADNAVGSSQPASSALATVTVGTVPGAPTNVRAVPGGDGAAMVSWTAPADNGGSPITGYTVTPSQGGVLAGTLGRTSTKVPELVNGAAYSFTVQAINRVGSGSPSAASNAIFPFAGGSYHPLPPERILDTRDGTGAVPRSPLGPAGTLNVQIAGHGGIPTSGVSAVVLNATVTDTSASSYLTIYPTGVTRPTASNLNWVAGKTVPNLVEVAVGQGGQVTIFNALGTANVLFDVAGWVGVESNSAGADGLYNPVVPNRVLDTRSGRGGVPVAKLGAGQTISIKVAGTLNVPSAGIEAVALNVTVTGPTAGGYLTVFPTGTLRPVASNLNFVPGQTVPNRVIVKVDAGGWVSFYNPAGSVHVIADLGGWFTDATSPAGGARFSGIAPTRMFDSRQGFGALGPGESAGLTVLDRRGHPVTGVSAVVINVTVTNTTASSFLTVWPEGASRPEASDLNWVRSQTVPNLVVVKLGAGSAFDLFNAGGSTDVVVDLVGFYGVSVAPEPMVPVAGAGSLPFSMRPALPRH